MNILIVEGKDDEAFLTWLIDIIKVSGIQVESPKIIQLGGLSSEKLSEQLGSIINRIAKHNIEKLGIIIDIDTIETGGGREKRLELVNAVIKAAFESYNNETGSSVDIPSLSDIGTENSINVSIDENTAVNISCYFIHLDSKGELEDILREIKFKDSPSYHADCLESWRECLKNKGIEKKDKDFNKLWVHYYLKYDICTPKEQEHASKNCNLETLLQNKERQGKIFNSEHKCLDELKTFLELFATDSSSKE